MKILSMTLMLILLSTQQAYSANLCSEIFSLAQVRELSSVTELRIMSYNMQDFFLKLGKYKDMPQQQYEDMIRAPMKSEEQIVGSAKAIRDTNPDFVIAEEVEGKETLAAFSQAYLGDQYNAFGVPGNDTRGIQIGFLIKKDLPLDITIESHKDLQWFNDDDGQHETLFSRDLPALIIRPRGSDKPALIVIGMHAKAKIDRENDPQSRGLRTAQMEATAEIIADYQKKYGANVPIIMGGDFNIDVRTQPDVAAVKEKMVDGFDIAKTPTPARITHTYHPRGGGLSEFGQLDTIFVSPALRANVISMQAYRFKDRNGRELPIPQNHEEAIANPSDHYPVFMRLSTEKIFRQAN